VQERLAARSQHVNSDRLAQIQERLAKIQAASGR
jgi:hypothetical protein